MVGNDVVDLADPETRSGPAHRRFDARVFTRDERGSLQVSGAPNRLRWMLWAAKEAAYKLAKKRDSEVVFSPVRFAVRMGASLRGEVVHQGEAFPLSLSVEGDAVHAVVGDGADARIATGVAAAPPPSEASHAVRGLALRVLAERLEAPPDALRIGGHGRIPTLEVRGLRTPLDLSLSHHGRFVAFACDLAGSPA